MAQVSDLTAIQTGSIGGGDLLYIVDVASGTNHSRKITLAQLGKYVADNYTTSSSSGGGGLASGDIHSWALDSNTDAIPDAKLANIREWVLKSDNTPIPTSKLSNVESWALIGGGAIPAGKLTNAPSGGGGGLSETQVKGLIADWAETGNTSDIPPGKLPAASVSAAGAIEIATQNEADALSSNTKALTPGNVPDGTTSQKGVVELTSAQSSTDETEALTPKGAYDTATARITTVVKAWARDDSTLIPASKLTNAPGGGTGASAIVEEVSTDKTFYLDEKWDSWVGNNVFFQVSNGTDNPKITISPKKGTKGQTLSIPRQAVWPGTSFVIDFASRSDRPRFTDSDLLSGITGNRYLDYLSMDRDGDIQLRISTSASRTASANGQDLATDWENTGKIKITIRPGTNNEKSVTISAPNNNAQRYNGSPGNSAGDPTEVYQWRVPAAEIGNVDTGTDDGLLADFIRIENSASDNAYAVSIEFSFGDSIEDWTPANGNEGKHINLHPLWQGGRIHVAGMAIARHGSDGEIETLDPDDDGFNITEGEGEPARLIYANNYYNGTTASKWHVLPVVQDTRKAINEYDVTVVHKAEVEHLEDRVDKALKDEKTSYTLPYFPIFDFPTGITAQNLADGHIKVDEYNLETFATSVTVKIDKGSHVLRVEEEFSDHTKVTTLNTIFNLKGFPEEAGDIKNQRIAVYVETTVSNAGLGIEPSSGPLAMYADANSGRLLSPCPVDFSASVAPNTTRSNGEKVYTDNLLYFVYFRTEGSLEFVDRNVISTSADSITVPNRAAKTLRIVGDEGDIDNARAIVNDHLGITSADKAFLIFEDSGGTKQTMHIGAFGRYQSLASVSALNADLHYADITLGHSGSNIIPENANLQFFYEEPKPATWAEAGNVDKIPSSKIPTGSGAGGSEQGSFTIIAETTIAAQAVTGSSAVTLGGAGGLGPINANATHMEIEITTPANQTPSAGSTLLYVPPGKTNTVANRRNVIDEDTGLAINVPINSTRRYRFSKSFLHSDNKLYLVLSANGSAGTTFGGSAITITIRHESNADSAAVEALSLLDTETAISNQTNVSANLTGATMTDVEFDEFVEYDQIISVTALFRTTDVWNEDAYFRFYISKDELDKVGEFSSTDSLASQTAIKGWFRSGWVVSNEQNWVAKPSSRFVKFEYDKSTGLPRMILGYYKDGVYLQGLRICAFGTQTKVHHVSVMRKKG